MGTIAMLVNRDMQVTYEARMPQSQHARQHMAEIACPASCA